MYVGCFYWLKTPILHYIFEDLEDFLMKRKKFPKKNQQIYAVCIFWHPTLSMHSNILWQIKKVNLMYVLGVNFERNLAPYYLCHHFPNNVMTINFSFWVNDFELAKQPSNFIHFFIGFLYGRHQLYVTR